MASEHVSKDSPRKKFMILRFRESSPKNELLLPPFTITTRDGQVLHTVDEVTEHLLQADRLSDQAYEQLLQNLTSPDLSN